MIEKKHFQGDLIVNPGEVYDYTSVSGNLDARGADTRCAFPRLTSVGGSVDASGANTRCAFPRLTSVGGSVNASGGDWRRVEIGNPTHCLKMLMESFAKSGYSFADNILAKIVSVKGCVSRVILVGKTKISYLVTDGVVWSHGETLKVARDGLIYKISSRDTTEFKNWKHDTVVTLSQAIKSYRAITGACEQGVKIWMENKKIPESMTISQAIALTRGAYGADAFAAFFKG